MSLKLNEENGGKLLAVHISGKLTTVDYNQFVPEFERLVLQHGKLDALFDITHFHGWDAAALWEDIKFDLKHLSNFKRLAIVGEKNWQKALATCCKRFTKATVRYFDQADAIEARKWLNETFAK